MYEITRKTPAWVIATIAGLGGVVATAAMLVLVPPLRSDDYVVPVDGVVAPSWYTPFTQIPRQPHSSTVYYPPGYTRHGVTSPER